MWTWFLISQVLLMMNISDIPRVHGTTWWKSCCCFGCFRPSRRIHDVDVPNPRPFMHLNQSTPSQHSITRKNLNHARSALSHHYVHQYCLLIIDGLPWGSRRQRDDQIRDELIRKCIKRWHELIGESASTPWQKYRVSDTVHPQKNQSNLVMFKLDGVIMDTRVIPVATYRAQNIREYNKNDLVFNPVPHRENVHLPSRIRKLAIYRRGLMQLFHTLRSGQITNHNCFDIALFGDGNRYDIVYHAVAMEVFFNWHYLRMNEKNIFRLHGGRLQELQINFKFATNGIPKKLSMDRYHRVFIVDSEISAHALALCSLSASQCITIKIDPFAIFSTESSFGYWFRERNRNDRSLDKVKAFMLEMDDVHHSKVIAPTTVVEIDQNDHNYTFSVWRDPKNRNPLSSKDQVGD